MVVFLSAVQQRVVGLIDRMSASPARAEGSNRSSPGRSPPSAAHVAAAAAAEASRRAAVEMERTACIDAIHAAMAPPTGVVLALPPAVRTGLTPVCCRVVHFQRTAGVA